MSKTVWGIDISKTSIKACKLTEGKGIPRILDVTILPYRFAKKKVTDAEQNELYLQALTNLNRSAKIGRDPVYISLPTHAIFNRIIKLPVDFDDPKFEQMVNYETASQIPFPIEQVTWNYLRVDREYQPGEEKEVVILAIKKDVVENFLDLIKPAGLNIAGVQISPFALFNFLKFDLGKLDNALIVDIGADNASLIVAESSRLWIRNLPVTGNDITNAIAEKLNVSFEEAEKLKINCATKPDRNIYQVMQGVYNNVVAEIHRSIGFYKTSTRNASFQTLLLLGQASRSYGLRQYLGKALQMEAVRVNRIHNVEVASSVAQELLGENISSIGVAVGLGLEGLGLTQDRLNLLPQSIVQEMESSKRKPWYIVASVLFVLFTLILYLNFSSKKSFAEEQQAKIDALIEQLSGNKNQYKTLEGKGSESLDTLMQTRESLFNIGKDRNIAVEQYMQILSKLPANSEEGSFDKRVWLLSSLCYVRYKADPRGRRNELHDKKVLFTELEVAISKNLGRDLTDALDTQTLNIKSQPQSREELSKYLKSLFPAELNVTVEPPTEIVIPSVAFRSFVPKEGIPRLFYLFKILIEKDL